MRVHFWFFRFDSGDASRKFLSSCLETKGRPRRMPKELHGSKTGTGRAGSIPLRAGAQMANVSAHSDTGRTSHLFLHPLSPGPLTCGRLTAAPERKGNDPGECPQDYR